MRRALLCVLLLACGDDTAVGDGGPDGSTGDATQNDVTSSDVAIDSAKDAGTDGGDASPPGAGKTTYTCPDGGTLVKPGDDLAAAVATSKAGDTICIQGVHRVQQALDPKSNQTWVGVTADATISGAQVLSPWTKQNGLWVYTGPLAKLGPSSQLHYGGATECYAESALQDDVFLNDQRLFRVTNSGDLGKTTPLADGLVQPPIEPGRFWFDYQGQAIWIDVDPTNAVVDLAVAKIIIDQNNNPSNVTFENLTIEKGLAVGIAANNATQYTLTDMTVRFIHNRGIYMPAGKDASNRTIVQHSLLTNNGQYAMDSTGSWILLKNDEISWNNVASYRDMGSGNNCTGYYAAGATKFVQSVGTTLAPGLWLDGVDSHDNVGDGFWTDVHNRYTLVENSTFHDNERNGYFHEISCDAEIRNNTAYGNGRVIMNAKNSFSAQAWGIFVSTSSYANVHDNVVWKNAGGGIQLELAVGHTNMQGIGCITPAPDSGTDTSHALENNQVHDNTIYACGGTIAGADENGNSGATSLLEPRNNAFTHNAYHAPDANKWWVDINTMTYAAWQSHDDAGTLVQSCTYP